MNFLIFLSFILKAFSFDYDLHHTTIQGSPRTMVCFHGYGGNYRIIEKLKTAVELDATLVAFNFPDHDIRTRKNQLRASYGTIDELLPAFSVLKKAVLDTGLDSVDLYGHSAGGAAILNLLATLNTSDHDKKLKKIGIGSNEKRKLLKAIEKGMVILDTPLKSVEEIIAFRGSSFKLELLAQQYKRHNSRPIDSINSLDGLTLNMLVFFQSPDEVLGNQDDNLFIKKLQKVNLGKTTVVTNDDGGHKGPHPTLWKEYRQLLNAIDSNH